MVTEVGNVWVTTHPHGRYDWEVWFWPEKGKDYTGGHMVSSCGEGDSFRKCEIIPHLCISAGDGCVQLPRPSERLNDLVHEFHQTRAVAPLLDCLIEEFPELADYTVGLFADGLEVASET